MAGLCLNGTQPQIYNLTICSYIHQAIPALPAFLRSRKERPSNKRNQPLLANVTVDWMNVLYFVGFSCMLVLMVSNGPVIAVAKKAAKIAETEFTTADVDAVIILGDLGDNVLSEVTLLV